MTTLVNDTVNDNVSSFVLLNEATIDQLELEINKRRQEREKLLIGVPKPLEYANYHEVENLLRNTIEGIALGEYETIDTDMAYVIVHELFAAVYGPEFNKWYLKTAKDMLF